MNIGIMLIGVSVVCLVASMAFGAPLMVNVVGFVAGMAGLIVLGRGRRGG